jgi:hypothetical protein
MARRTVIVRYSHELEVRAVRWEEGIKIELRQAVDREAGMAGGRHDREAGR